MTIEDFTNKADGLINDFSGGASDEKEFRDGILDLLLEVATPAIHKHEIAEDGVYCHDCLDKIINDDIEKFDGDTKYTSNIICPHCGYEDQDSWEMTEDSGEVNCSRRDKEFFVERDVTVTYSTSKC